MAMSVNMPDSIAWGQASCLRRENFAESLSSKEALLRQKGIQWILSVTWKSCNFQDKNQPIYHTQGPFGMPKYTSE